MPEDRRPGTAGEPRASAVVIPFPGPKARAGRSTARGVDEHGQPRRRSTLVF